MEKNHKWVIDNNGIIKNYKTGAKIGFISSNTKKNPIFIQNLKECKTNKDVEWLISNWYT